MHIKIVCETSESSDLLVCLKRVTSGGIIGATASNINYENTYRKYVGLQ